MTISSVLWAPPAIFLRAFRRKVQGSTGNSYQDSARETGQTLGYRGFVKSAYRICIE